MRPRLMLALVLAVAATSLVGCSEDPGTRPATTNSTSNTTVGGGPTTNTAPTVAPPTNQSQVKPPIEMKDTIEGKVIGLLCYKDNPNATPEAAIACAKKMVVDGGALVILDKDGVVYINDMDPGSNNTQLQYFIGETVTIQGVHLGDLPDQSWGNVKVKKFDMRLVRRKGAPPPGTEKQMVPDDPNKPRKK